MARSDEVGARAEPTDVGNAGQLHRGLSLVRIVIAAPSPLTLSELAERAELDPSTVSRLTQILIGEGYLVRQGAGKRYSAGPRAVSLLSPYHPVNVFRRETSELLQRLRDSCGETSALVVFLGFERLIIEIAQGREALAPFYDTWLRTPLHASATGKVLLSYLGPKQQRALLGPDPLPKSTAKSCNSLVELEKDLLSVRANGFIVSRDEVYAGITAIAAPIIYGQNIVAALSVVGSSDRLSPASCQEISLKMRDAATLISNATPSLRALGHYLGS